MCSQQDLTAGVMIAIDLWLLKKQTWKHGGFLTPFLSLRTSIFSRHRARLDFKPVSDLDDLYFLLCSTNGRTNLILSLDASLLASIQNRILHADQMQMFFPCAIPVFSPWSAESFCDRMRSPMDDVGRGFCLTPPDLKIARVRSHNLRHCPARAIGLLRKHNKFVSQTNSVLLSHIS